MWRRAYNRVFVVAFFIMLCTGASAASCRDVVARGWCAPLDPVCVWCNVSAATGTYCINVTDTATASPQACGPCSSLTGLTQCRASFSSLSGLPCQWCTSDFIREGPYCTAPLEVNENCDDCTYDENAQYGRCTAPLDKQGLPCQSQCGINPFKLVSCDTRASNCTDCATVTRKAFCYALRPDCFWCDDSHDSGDYCTSRAMHNANCDCSSGVNVSKNDCSVAHAGDWTYCHWCPLQPQASNGPYCVPQLAPPRWCQVHCWDIASKADCNADGNACSWCGGEKATGYYCGLGTLHHNPNCTLLCSTITTRDACEVSTDDLNQDCRWCDMSTDEGPHCFSITDLNTAHCPSCDHYTNATQCAQASVVTVNVSYRCEWCNPTASTGPYCGGYFHANPNCPLCSNYTDKATCRIASSQSGTLCVWCNMNVVHGSYCSESEHPNPQCLPCDAYSSFSLCKSAFVNSTDSLCTWCNGLSTSGPYCSAGTASCGDCEGYVKERSCVASFDAAGPCQWCNATASTGPFCTGAARANANCPCHSSTFRVQCEASYGVNGSLCTWCAAAELEGAFCLDVALNETCPTYQCDAFTDYDACQVNCVWCGGSRYNGVCRRRLDDCPFCSYYSSESDCTMAHSRGLTVASCFQCSPTLISGGACASIVRNDPSVCPACNVYATRTLCENSLASFDVACRWCDVSYSCVRSDEGCGDCFSFLVPGNRLKPYWLSFVAVVKDYLVLLLAVAVAPKLAHLHKRASRRCRGATTADDRHVVVYVAQNEVVDGDDFSAVGTLTDCIAKAATAALEESDVDAVGRYFVRGNVLWLNGSNADSGGAWVHATYVSSRHVLQRAAYAAVLPPNFIVLGLSVLSAVGLLVAVGLQTHHDFTGRRATDASLFDTRMLVIVLGYRVVNSGLQPTAALTLWQCVVSLARRFPRHARPSANGALPLLSTWSWPVKLLAAVQLLLFAPIWGVSVVGVVMYAWVLLPACCVVALFALLARRVLSRSIAVSSDVAVGERAPLMRQSISVADVDSHDDDTSPNCAQASTVQPVKSDSPAPMPASTTFLHEVANRTATGGDAIEMIPQLRQRGHRLLAALLVFVCERAIPVLAISTALQTGYNYAALYVLAPGHVFCGYTEAVGLEFAARSEACLVQDVHDALANTGSFGDAVAGALSFVLPFA